MFSQGANKKLAIKYSLQCFILLSAIKFKIIPNCHARPVGIILDLKTPDVVTNVRCAKVAYAQELHNPNCIEFIARIYCIRFVLEDPKTFVSGRVNVDNRLSSPQDWICLWVIK